MVPMGLRSKAGMKLRWAVAAASALGLALLTLNSSEIFDVFDFRAHATSSPGGAACPANAKPAKLSFTLKDYTGKTVRLSDYKGKVILLDFWATWCEPCKLEIPWFIEFQKKYGANGFQAIGVSVDDTAAQLTPYVAKMKMNYPVLQGKDHDDIQNAYGPLVGIPVTVVISRDAKICVKHLGISTRDGFEKEIKSLLGPFD
jgi:cytochrome c biogenesis protein CcmG/thiol:disulfide interchange protein DsbE